MKLNNIQIFKNLEFGNVRAIEINGCPYFVGRDIAEILGYQNPNRSIREHVDEEDKGVTEMVTPGGRQTIVVINESGVYSLILRSNMPRAREFKRWVTSEILPAIRRHGAYMTDQAIHRAITEPDFLIRLATELKSEREEKQKALQKIDEDRPKVLFADAVATSHTSILIGELAKIMRGNGVDIGQKRLFEWLRQNGYLIKRIGTDYNMPTQYSMELGLFEIKEGTYINGSGANIITKTPKVTGKGQAYFINKFLQVKNCI